ncbi:MAG TPA: methyltransferase domain-containing protein [Roseiflexaceae bacterium]|nr:methyltransferase domain-containing protein [Roseiflexaceae bacterium]
MFVTALRRCNKCGLLYRTPTTTTQENAEFYQEAYSQGFTTDMPTSEQLKALLSTSFNGTEKDYSVYISILEALGCRPGQRVLDFGCSWGYGSWQLMQAGFDVTGYEISKRRCAYAKEALNVAAFDSLEGTRGPFDIFFSAHVLEHVPSVSNVISYALQSLERNGLFIAFTPNGSKDFRARNVRAWHRLWGAVHPQLIDDVFYEKMFGGFSYLLASNPYDLSKIKNWAGQGTMALNLDGGELLIAVRNTADASMNNAIKRNTEDKYG